MSKLLLIGDVHGEINKYIRILQDFHQVNPNGETIQVGDMGVGFPGVKLPELPKNDLFIRGNHDDPSVSYYHNNYAGEFGVHPRNQKIFFAGGAWSIDKAYRTEGIDWWPGEQLTIEQLEETIEFYEQVKPEIMVTHDCPNSLYSELFGYDPARGNRQTPQALSIMLDIHRPKVWVFGHHHKSRDVEIGGTRFVCLKSLETLELDI